MKKIITNLPLHNRYFFWSTVIVMVTLMVMFVNYFFYQTKDKTLKYQLEDTVLLIGSYYDHCLKVNPETVCKEQLVAVVNSVFDYGTITVLDSNNRTLIELDKESYKDNRNLIDYRAKAGNGDSEIEILISKLSSPPTYQSTFNSMTFSIFDIIDNMAKGKDYLKFAWETAVPRSASVMYAGLIIFLIMRMLSLKSLAQQRKNEYLLKRINSKNVALQDALSKTDKAIIELEELKQKAELEGEMSKLYEDDLKAKEREVAQFKDQEEKLKKEIWEREEKIKDLINTKDVNQIILENPKLELLPKKFPYNAGSHHGKHILEAIFESLLVDEYGSKMIVKGNHIAFGPESKGSAILSSKKLNNVVYTLNVYEHKVGYGLELVLNAKNSAEALLVAKYLTFVSKGFLKSHNYKLVIARDALN